MTLTVATTDPTVAEMVSPLETAASAGCFVIIRIGRRRWRDVFFAAKRRKRRARWAVGHGEVYNAALEKR